MSLYPVCEDSKGELAVLKQFIRLLYMRCQPVSETVAKPFRVGDAHMSKDVVQNFHRLDLLMVHLEDVKAGIRGVTEWDVES